MSKLATGLVSFIVVLGVGAVLLQRETIVKLRDEVAALRGEVRQVARQQKDAADRLRPEASARQGAVVAVITPESGATDGQQAELAKLRAEVRALAASTQEVARVTQAAQQAAKGESPIPVKLIPVSEWKNAGRATASAAIETMLWAAVGGDVETLANSIVLDSTAQAKAQELFARLPEATRAQYGSPDKLIALFLAKDAAAVTGMQILGQRDVTPDLVGVRVRVANDEGKTKEQNFGLQKTPDGLRLKIPDELVDKYAKQLSGAGK